MKVLVVDDDPVAAAVIEAALKRHGHECVIAPDGATAWALFQTGPVPVVVSDWQMPGLDGLELCRRVRARGGDYTYFILVSHREAAGANLEQAAEAGVDDFLAKPLQPLDLWMRLRVAERILGYARQVQQLESFIPICSYCKKVRDDRNFWSQIENYIRTRTGSQFSHGVCPDCYDAVLVPQMRAAGITPPPQRPTVRRVDPPAI
jgi:DNA-binding response OmpR family regulator